MKQPERPGHFRLGGEEFKGFEGDLGQIPWDEPQQEPCVLCLRLDSNGRCDGTFKCPYIEEMREGRIPECIEY